MQGSPASPKPTLPTLFAELAQDGSRLPLSQLPLTAQKGQATQFMKTPGTLSKGAHRVPQPHSALKDTSTKLSFAGAVNHFSQSSNGTPLPAGLHPLPLGSPFDLIYS
eukprot:1150796-Pelagomonas_calceolata.AAC.7